MPTDFPTDDAATQALRDGLAALPTPAVSPDFDARILAALRSPDPWWRCWWQPIRPVLFSAAGSLTAMLVLLHWTLSGPLPAHAAPPILATAPARMPSIDALLDRPNLCAASLEQDWSSLTPVPLPAGRRAEPRRRADIAVTTTLIA